MILVCCCVQRHMIMCHERWDLSHHHEEHRSLSQSCELHVGCRQWLTDWLIETQVFLGSWHGWLPKFVNKPIARCCHNVVAMHLKLPSSNLVPRVFKDGASKFKGIFAPVYDYAGHVDLNKCYWNQKRKLKKSKKKNHAFFKDNS